MLSPCPRPALARCYSPPRWPPRDEGAALPFPPGTASSPRVPCSRRAPSTARLSTARHRLVEAPACSASPQPAGRERARRAHAQSCSSRATACPSLEYLLWTDPPSPGCAASLASRRPALGHTSATLQPHTAPAQQPAVPCAFVPLLPPTSDPCHTLGQPLCSRCGGGPPDLWSPSGSRSLSAALLPIV